MYEAKGIKFPAITRDNFEMMWRTFKGNNCFAFVGWEASPISVRQGSPSRPIFQIWIHFSRTGWTGNEARLKISRAWKRAGFGFLMAMWVASAWPAMAEDRRRARNSTSFLTCSSKPMTRGRWCWWRRMGRLYLRKATEWRHRASGADHAGNQIPHRFDHQAVYGGGDFETAGGGKS